PVVVQPFDTRASRFPKLFQVAELDRIGRTRLRAGRFHVLFQAVVTEGTLPGAAVVFPPVDYPERAVHDTVATTVAYVRLYVNAVVFRADDCAGGAAFQTARAHPVLADVRRE